MALHRKADALLSLRPDIAVVAECASPERLRSASRWDWIEGDPVWLGRNPAKGLAVLAFNGYRASLAEGFSPHLRYIAPVHIAGPVGFNLLAVWAQNASAGVTRKHQPGPLRLAMRRYHDFLSGGPTAIAGDFNSNAIWDKPGWRINHMTMVEKLRELGLRSAYHEITGERQGEETVPTHYWRDRRKDGPTYHIDYVFLPEGWFAAVKNFTVGTFEEWCGSGLSDHVPLVVDLDL